MTFSPNGTLSQAPASLPVRHAVMHVVLCIEAGLEADRRGFTAEAVGLLRSACQAADALIPILPRAHANVLARRLALARGRLLSAQSALQVAADDDEVPPGSSLKVGPIEIFSSIPTGRYVPPPASALQRPFWLLHQLGASMQGSAWITPSLRIDKSVWLQDSGASVLSFVSAKAKLLEALCRGLEPVASMATRDENLLPALDTCLHATGRSLADFEVVAHQEDGRVEQLGRLERGMRSILSKSRGVLRQWNMQQDTSQGTYVAWAFRFCNAASGLERLLLECHQCTSSDPQRLDVAVDRINRLAHSLLRGPCRFLLEDVLLLCEKAIHARTKKLNKTNLQWV
jgi:hypothetical protein